MAEEFKALTEEELLALVNEEIKGSIGYNDGDLSSERQKMLRYYHGELPERQNNGNSSYVSQDIYDSVEGLKALLLETFSAGTDVVEFSPQGGEDVDTARTCTAYTNYVMHRQNDGFSIFRDVIHDGLLARNGIVKIYWDRSVEETEEKFDDLTSDQMDMVLAQENYQLKEISDEDETGLFSGIFIRSADKSQVRIENVPPEEFLINPMAKNVHDGFIAHRTILTKSALIQMGFDAALVENLAGDEDPLGETFNEKYYRKEQVGPMRVKLNENNKQAQLKEIVCYESYVNADMEGDGVARLYKVLTAGNTLLDYEEVDQRPFLVFTPIPVSHSFHGENFAYKMMPIQNARTVLCRSILDHASVTTNPRYLVTKGALLNPRELLDNRLGGIVNVSRPDGVVPLIQNQLNPFIFQTMQMLEEDMENTSGVSKLSQGLNKDAVSKQNSAAMVENLVTLSQQRSKIIARNFANNFLKPLFLEVYRLCIENETDQKIVEVAGNYINIDPIDWSERKDVEVKFKLGYGEADRESQKFTQLHAMLSQDPGIQPFYASQNKYAMVRQALLNAGIKDVDTYLTPPEKVPPPQPDPVQQMQMQIEQKKIELEERKVALQEQQAQVKSQTDMANLELAKQKFNLDERVAFSEEERKDFDSEKKAEIAEEEMKLLKTSSKENRTAIVSPNS